MTKFEHFLKDTLAYKEARKAPPEKLSPRAEEAIKAALAKKFGQARVLSVEEMRVAILKLLDSEGTATGAEIISRLGALKLSMEPKGDGAILGLLHQMVDRGLVFPRFDESTATRRYKIEDAGTKLLKKEAATVLGGWWLAAVSRTQA